MPRGELPSIPDNAHLLAWDHRRRKVVAYDVNHKFLGNVATRSSSSHTKRQTKGTPCTLVDQSTLRRVEGYHLLEEYAATKWGADWDRMLTNPPEYPDNGASVCVQDVPPAMNVDGAPSCTAEESTIAGTDAKTSGILPLAYERGTTTELELTVTQASTFPWLDGPMLAKVNTPSLAGNLESFPADITVLNQDTATASFNGNTLRNTTVSATASAGQTCSLTLTKTSCTGAASGRLQVAARGWLWVNYGSTRDGHYHWAISIDQVITNVEQRSSYMEFKANTKSSGVTIATPRCAFANGTTPKPASTSVESNSTPQQGVSPVLVAVPVVLGIFAFILGIVAFIIWRRRRRNATDAAPGPMTQSSNNSTYPEVRPIWLPPASSAPSTSITGHSRGQPSIDTSAGMTVSSAQGGGGYVSEKYRGAAPFNTTSPEGPLPPAYSEATVQSSSSAARSAMR